MSSKLAMMPWHIKQRIGQLCDLESRLALRKLSSEFRHLIDRSPTFYREICFQIEENQIILVVTDSTDKVLIIKYFKASEGCVVKKMFKRNLVKGACHVERAILDFKALIRSPRTYVKMLKIINEECFRRFEDAGGFEEDKEKFFRILQRQLQKQKNLNVETLRCKFPLEESQVLCVLPYLNPMSLQYIRFGHNFGGSWHQVTELDQWKQARRLRFGQVEDIPIAKMAHFESIRIKGCRVGLEELKQFIEKILSQNTLFRHFLATDLRYNYPEIQLFLSKLPRMILGDSEVGVIQKGKLTLYIEASEDKILIYNSDFKAEQEEEEEEEDSEKFDDCDDYGSCYV